MLVRKALAAKAFTTCLLAGPAYAAAPPSAHLQLAAPPAHIAVLGQPRS